MKFLSRSKVCRTSKARTRSSTPSSRTTCPASSSATSAASRASRRRGRRRWTPRSAGASPSRRSRRSTGCTRRPPRRAGASSSPRRCGRRATSGRPRRTATTRAASGSASPSACARGATVAAATASCPLHQRLRLLKKGEKLSFDDAALSRDEIAKSFSNGEELDEELLQALLEAQALGAVDRQAAAQAAGGPGGAARLSERGGCLREAPPRRPRSADGAQ